MTITLVATLGGLLFGYDTAVISGAVGSLKGFFILRLVNDAALATQLIFQFKVLIVIFTLMVLALLGYFFIQLIHLKRGLLLLLILTTAIFSTLFYQVFPSLSHMSELLINSLNGFTISSALVGCIIGGSGAGLIAQRVGRKVGLTIAAGLFLISAIGSAYPEPMNIYGVDKLMSFIIYRIIGGIGVGLASMLSPMYIAELAPASVRGKLVSWNQFAIIFGMLVVYFVNYFISLGMTDEWINTTGWRYMFLSEAIPAGLFLFLLFFVPKTPRFLVMTGHSKEAEKMLKKINGSNMAEELLGKIKASFNEESSSWLSFGGLVIIVGILLSVFQQFVGINVVLYYAPEIFRNMGMKTDASLLQTIIVGAINLLFTVIAIYSVDKLGRKPLMISGALLMGISMMGLGFTFYLDQVGMASLLFMLLYVAAFAFSWGPVTWVLLSEIFPNSIRSAMAIAVAAQWVANLMVSWTFPMLNDSRFMISHFNHGFAYWIYGIMGFLAALFMYKLVPETKGRQLEEMENIWNSN